MFSPSFAVKLAIASRANDEVILHLLLNITFEYCSKPGGESKAVVPSIDELIFLESCISNSRMSKKVFWFVETLFIVTELSFEISNDAAISPASIGLIVELVTAMFSMCSFAVPPLSPVRRRAPVPA